MLHKTLQDDALLPASWTRSTASRVASLNAPQAPFSRKSSMVPLISSRSTFHQEAMILLRTWLMEDFQNQGFQKNQPMCVHNYMELQTSLMDCSYHQKRKKMQKESRKLNPLAISRPKSITSKETIFYKHRANSAISPTE